MSACPRHFVIAQVDDRGARGIVDAGDPFESIAGRRADQTIIGCLCVERNHSNALTSHDRLQPEVAKVREVDRHGGGTLWGSLQLRAPIAAGRNASDRNEHQRHYASRRNHHSLSATHFA